MSNYEGQGLGDLVCVGGGGEEYLIKHRRTGHESGSYIARVL